MGLGNIGKKIFSNVIDEFSNKLNGGVFLKDAAREAPNAMGCYKLYCDGELKYVGKAEYGLRHRFVQYYNGTTAGYSSGAQIYENRERIFVSWLICNTKEECRAVEANWIRLYKPKWNVQAGWKRY